MASAKQQVLHLWELLNAHEFEAAGALLHRRVDWANILESGRLSGPEAVIAYWRRMMDYIRPESQVVGIETLADGRLAARMHHVLRRPGGALWTQEDLTQVFAFSDGLIVGMDPA